MLRKAVAYLLALSMTMGIGTPSAFAQSQASGFSDNTELPEIPIGDNPNKYDLHTPTSTLHAMPSGNYDFTINSGSSSYTNSRIKTVVPPTIGVEASWFCDESDSLRTAKSYSFQLCELESTVGSRLNLSTVYIDRTQRDNGNFAYTIREPGTYVLYCNVTWTNGTTSTEKLMFDVNAAAGAVTVSSKVAEIVRQCYQELGANAGDYDVALWLHDWMTHHSRYDTSFNYYGADGILFMGTGVCDSYSKLYQRLLTEAGIDCERQTGTRNGSRHTWNTACINGAWCQIDSAWDDPIRGYSDAVVSGAERYDYFGLTDELMQIDHEYEVVHPCTSMANCHALVSQTYRRWFSHIWNIFGDTLNQGRLTFEVSNNGRVMSTGKWYYSGKAYVDRCSAIAAACMNELDWTMLTHPVDATFTYDSSSQRVRCSVELGEAEVTLPARAKKIEESAFSGDQKISTVEIQGNVTDIGDQAFANCSNLFWIRIPTTVTNLGQNVFKGIDRTRFMVVCEKGSAAEAYCQATGIVACTG